MVLPSSALRERGVTNPAFLTIAAAALALTLAAVTHAISWYGHPFAGVFVDRDLVVSSVAWPTWSGPRQGLHFPDRIVSIDGASLDHLDSDARIAAWERRIEDAVRTPRPTLQVEVSTATGERTLDLAVGRFNAAAWWTQAGSLTSAGAMYILAALLAIATSPRGRLARSFAKLAVFSATFMLTLFDFHTSRALVPLFLIAFAMTPVAMVGLALRLPDDARILRRRPWIVPLLDGIGASFALTLLWRHFTGRELGIARILCGDLLVVGAFAFAGILTARWIRARGERRQQLGNLLAAMAPIPIICTAIPALASLSSLSALAFCTLPGLALAPLATVYAFIRHDLWGSRALLSRAFTLTIVAVGVCVAAVCGGGAFVAFFGIPFRQGLAGAAAGGAFAAALVALALRASDRGFFSARAEYKPTIEQLSEHLVAVNRPAEVARAVERTVERWLACESIRFELLPAPGRSNSAPPSPSSGPSLAAHAHAHAPSVLALPVTFRGDALGVLHLGAKKGGALFTSEDIDLLRTIANQTAVALAHAHSYSELEERRRQQLAAMRDERLALIETMAAEVAHEVRYPINFFRSIFSRNARGESMQLDAEAFEIGGEEVDRLERLVSGLRRVSTHRVERRNVPLEQLVARAEVLLADRLGGRKLAFDAADIVLRCDFDQATQVVVNLLSNALDAARDSLDVGITWRPDARGGGELTVWDGGPGFDVDEAELFAPWFTTKPRGTGLGLALSQRIVRAHGWSIAAKRRDGRTEFRIGVPAEDIARTLAFASA